MRRWTLAIAGMVGLAAVASGQTNDLPGITVPDAATLQQMTEARMQFMQSDRCKELRSAMEAADREYFETASEIPELKQLDAQVAELARQTRELRMIRIEKENTFPVLVEKKAAAAEARKAFHDALMAATRGEAAK